MNKDIKSNSPSTNSIMKTVFRTLGVNVNDQKDYRLKKEKTIASSKITSGTTELRGKQQI